MCGAAQPFGNRLRSHAFGAPIAIGVATLTSAAASPRTIAGRLIDELTQGVTLPAANQLPVAETDWRVAILASRDVIISTTPSVELILG